MEEGEKHMNWSEKCLLELTHHNMFESADHRLRYRDLLDCFHTAVFFTKSLAKCMYTATWDEYHFAELLITLNEMTIGGDEDCSLIKEQLEINEASSNSSEANIFRLCLCFLNGTHYIEPDYPEIDPEVAHIIKQALQVSVYIDELPEIVHEKSRRYQL